MRRVGRNDVDARVRVEKSLMKNQKNASVPADVMPSDSNSARSSAPSVKFCATRDGQRRSRGSSRRSA